MGSQRGSLRGQTREEKNVKRARIELAKRLTGAVLMMVAVTAVAACGSSNAGGSGGSGAVTVGEIYPLTGPIAGPGGKFLDGAKVAVADVNAHGGVLGKKMAETVADDSGDAVDAVPALRKLLIHNITFLSGPLSPTFPALKSIIDQQQIPAMAGIPSSQFDSLNDKWVYRTVVSDSVLGTAMAYYALSHHLMTCSFLFENIQSAQGLVQPITAAYTRHGGKVLDSEQLVPHASSYRSEIEKAVAKNPQCIFAQDDPTTSGTLFSEMASLGRLNIPVVGTDQFIDPAVAHAVGLPTMNKWFTGMTGAAPTGPAATYFTALYKKTYGQAPISFGADTYDGIVVAALAMDIAGTTNGKVWVNDISKVTDNESAKQCTTYNACYAIIKQKQPIDYEGASGPMDFDAHHSVFSGIDVERFTTAGQLQVVKAITADQLKGY
jgi:ABC-type branched-subunit amino acid transport system substrate-binding protein